MSQPLFVDTKLSFDKVAASEPKLSDNPDTWPDELTQEMNKQHGYIGNYDFIVNMMEVDGDRNYGLGFYEISSKTNHNLSAPAGQSLAVMEGTKTVRVPIIIKEGKLKPLDIFLTADGSSQPLTEERLRAALYRPQLFDAAATRPPGVSIVNDLYPPSSDRRTTMGHGTIYDAETQKLSSARRTIMDKIAHTIFKSDIEKVKAELSKEANLLPALISNPASLPYIELLRQAEITSAESVEKVASAFVKPDVVQLKRVGNSYFIKVANSEMYDPAEIEVDRFTAEKQVGRDLVTSADNAGSAVVSTNPVVRETAEDEKVEVVKRFGYYRVKMDDGKELVGWVFPTVIDYSGTSLPMTLFTNGSVAAIQSEIAGSFAGQHTNVIRSKPEGHGFFYRITDNGSAIAFVPSVCKGTFVDDSGVGFVVESLGADFVGRVRPIKGFEGIQDLGNGEVAIPGDVRWAPLEDATHLMEDPEMFAKTASLLNRRNSVRIISDGSSWSFQGLPVEKIANDKTQFLSGNDAHFLAVSLGMSPKYAAAKLVKSAKLGEVHVSGCRSLNTYQEKVAEARGIAARLIEQLPRKRILLKEAASLTDEDTVDKVLSIGFVNPENVDMFVEFLPDFEETLGKISQTLIASRLGLQDVPEAALKTCMEQLNKVIGGLKALTHRREYMGG